MPKGWSDFPKFTWVRDTGGRVPRIVPDSRISDLLKIMGKHILKIFFSSVWRWLGQGQKVKQT